MGAVVRACSARGQRIRRARSGRTGSCGVSRQERHRSLRRVLRGRSSQRRERRRQLASGRTGGRVHRQRRAGQGARGRPRLRADPRCHRIVVAHRHQDLRDRWTRAVRRLRDLVVETARGRPGCRGNGRGRRVPALFERNHRTSEGRHALQQQLLRLVARGQGHLGTLRRLGEHGGHAALPRGWRRVGHRGNVRRLRECDRARTRSGRGGAPHRREAHHSRFPRSGRPAVHAHGSGSRRSRLLESAGDRLRRRTDFRRGSAQLRARLQVQVLAGVRSHRNDRRGGEPASGRSRSERPQQASPAQLWPSRSGCGSSDRRHRHHDRLSARCGGRDLDSFTTSDARLLEHARGDGQVDHQGRLVPFGRRGLSRRRRLPLHPRPREGHDRVGWRERVPGRSRERAHVASGHRRRGRDRRARRQVG